MKIQGYTLIEVIVVLLVLGILSAVAIPAWLSFWQRQRVRTAANQLQSALYLARQEANKNSVRYAVTVCSSPLGSLQSDWIKYSFHPYSDSPSSFTTIENITLVKSTFQRSPQRYNLLAISQGDCYTAYLGLFPDDGYALGFFYLSNRQRQYVYRVGFNTLIGNVVSCPVVSLEQAQCR
jgi:prepilin-type N-terminal cleavage/methylation domain-containing protein